MSNALSTHAAVHRIVRELIVIPICPSAICLSCRGVRSTVGNIGDHHDFPRRAIKPTGKIYRHTESVERPYRISRRSNRHLTCSHACDFISIYYFWIFPRYRRRLFIVCSETENIRRTKNVGFSEEFLNATCLSVFELWVTRKEGHVRAGGIVLGARGSLKFRDIFQLLLFEARRIGWRENGSIHSIVLMVLSKLWAFVSHTLFNI